jgi:hypothetical protein
MKRSISSRQFFQTLNLTYYIQAISLVLFSLVILFLINKTNAAPDPDDQVQWHYVVPVVVIISLTIAYVIFRMLVNKIDPSLRLQQKFPKYASALLIRTALLELPGLLAGIVAYLTLKPYFLGATALIFIILLVLRPTKHSIATDLRLSPKEKDLLDKDDAIVSETER